MNINLSQYQAKLLDAILEQPSMTGRPFSRGTGKTTAMLIAAVAKAKQLDTEVSMYVNEHYSFNYNTDMLKQIFGEENVEVSYTKQQATVLGVKVRFITRDNLISTRGMKKDTPMFLDDCLLEDEDYNHLTKFKHVYDVKWIGYGRK